MVHFVLRDEPELLPIAELYSIGITDTEQLGATLEVPATIVEMRKGELHRRLGEIRRSIEAGRAMADRMRNS